MSRQMRANPHDLFQENLHEAEGIRDKKVYERQQRLNEEKASIDALNREIAEEERIRNAKKAALRNEQLQEYSNYLKQKYEDPNYNKKGKNRGEVAIKIGSENRQITRKTYDEVSNGLVLNPMREKIPERQSRVQVQENNYGNQVKALRQRGQSHGYNIISNAFYEEGNNNNIGTQSGRRNEQNVNSNYGRSYQPQAPQYERHLPEYKYEEPIQPQRQIPTQPAESQGNNNGDDGFIASLSPEEREQYLNEYNKQKAQIEQEYYQQQQQPQIQNEQPSQRRELSKKEEEEENFRRYYEYFEMMKKNENNEANQGSQIPEPGAREVYGQQQFPESYHQYEEKQVPSARNDNQDELNAQMHRLSLQDEARNEYLANKKKNNSSFNSILNQQPPQKQATPKYNDMPMTINNKLEQQRQYREYLDSQINAKKIYQETVDSLTKNALNNNSNANPYKQMRDKNSKFKEIPSNPYSHKNYNFNNPGHDSYMTSNPITNPVSSYKFTDQRRVPSGRLRNLGNNIVTK